MAKTFQYSDFDLRFIPNPITGDIMMRYDVNAVLQSCRNLLLTSAEEIVMDMEIGGGVGRMLFELNTPNFITILKDRIITTLTKYEPRIDIEALDVNSSSSNEHIIVITLTFYILNQPDPITVDLPLRRTR